MSDAGIIRPDGWPRPSGYADAVSARGRIIALSGQIGWDPVTHELASDDFVEQVRVALGNIVALLAAAGAAPEHVVRMTWYITDRDEYLRAASRVGEAYRDVFGRFYPAMSVVVVAGLLEARARVEIEATAVV
jgi:enamine deaminase RidA (YjgF/YER057c/UK114 family)